MKKAIVVTEDVKVKLKDGNDVLLEGRLGIVYGEDDTRSTVLFPDLIDFVNVGLLDTPKYSIRNTEYEVVGTANVIEIDVDNDNQVEDFLNQLFGTDPTQPVAEELTNSKNCENRDALVNTTKPVEEEVVTTTFGRHKVINGGKHHLFPTGAIRSSNDGKPRLDLISPYALEAIGECFGENASEYGEGNYLLGIPPMKAIESMLRHLNTVQQGIIEGNKDKIAEYKNVLSNAVMLGHSMKLIEKGLYLENF